MKILKFLTILMLISKLCFAGASTEFDETGDVYSVSSSLSVSSASFISAWVNLDSTSEAGCFVKAGSGSTGAGLCVGSNDADTAGNHLLGLFEAVRWIDSNTSIGTGWHHVAIDIEINTDETTLVLDGVDLGDFGNGVLLAAATSSGIGGYADATTRLVDAGIAYVHVITATSPVSDTIGVPDRVINELMWKPEHWHFRDIAVLRTLAPLWMAASTEQDLSGNAVAWAVAGNPAESGSGPPVMFGGGLPL